MPSEKTKNHSVRVGISTCLLGQKVRFDGGHKHDHYITDILGPYFQFVPVCPELEIGMGVPRESVRLEGTADAPRMLGHKSRRDWTDKMNLYSEKRIVRRDISRLAGYILKKDSPSCGMERVRVYSPSGQAERAGRGLFASALLDRYPLLPVEEEGRLNDLKIRENFITRVFAYYRLQTLIRDRFSVGKLVLFHTAHKYLLLAHSPKHYQQLGRLVATAKELATDDLIDRYSRLFMEALKVRTTPRKNVNVLQHILGFLKEKLSADEKKDILRVIDDYHAELVPLIVPVILLRHYINVHNIAYIRDQIYLTPHPKELMLRNHV